MIKFMEITSELVKRLREKTGAGMMDCKRALEASGGDVERAITHLREQGMAQATKKSGRITKEGIICSHITEPERTGVLLELNCETDFVARTEEFKKLAYDLAAQIAQTNSDLSSISEQPWIKEKISPLIAKVGENIVLKRAQRYEISSEMNASSPRSGIIYSYIHPGEKLGVLIELNCQQEASRQNQDFKLLAKDLAMQVAAANPLVVQRTQLLPEQIEQEKEIYRTQAKNENKPEKIIERIVEGKLEKYYQEVCLLEQPFIKDENKIVQERIRETADKLKDNLTVFRFVRFRLGEV